MCACDYSFVCPRHRDTRHDPAYFDQPDQREQEQAAYERLISMPDFLQPHELVAQ